MVEVIGIVDFGSSTEVDLDIVPQIQFPLNRRQHVRMNLGASAAEASLQSAHWNGPTQLTTYS